MLDPAATIRRLASALAVVGLLTACGSENSGIRRAPLGPDASPAGVTIEPAAATLGFIGDTRRLSAQVTLADGTVASGFSVSWTSVTPSIATIDGSGNITAVSEGMTTVIARVVNLADTATVSVTRIASTISLSPDSVLLTEAGATAAISVTVADGGGEALPASVVRWQSQDTTVARVDQSGVVRAVADGVATIRATAGTAGASIRARVVTGPATVEVEPESLELRDAGDEARLSATVLDAAGGVVDAPVSWTSGDTSVVTVDSTGLVTAVAGGATFVTATADGASGAAAVTVVQVPSSIEVTPAAQTVLPGAGVQFVAIVEDAQGLLIPGAQVAWATSDPAIATVDGSGLATGVADGVASIIATTPVTDSTFLADTASLTVRTIVVDSVDVSPDVTVLRIGESSMLSIRFFQAGGAEIGAAPVTWTSRAPGRVSVNSSGGITGLDAGTAWIVGSSGGASDSASVTVSPDTVTVPPGEFDISVRYVGQAPSAGRLEFFNAAEVIWEDVLRGDQADAVIALEAGACGPAHPAVNESIDDVVIFVEIADFDGRGGTIGQVGPCVVRTANGLPLISTVRLDEADVAALESSGDLGDQIRREMGWALGFGISQPWRATLRGAGGADPYFPGAGAVARFEAAGFAAQNPVPVHNEGALGIRDATWRETILTNELMAGPLNLGVSNPLSAITIGAMQDLGYEVSFEAAETFPTSALSAGTPGSPLRIEVTLLQPRLEVDPSGRLLPIRIR